MRTKKTKLTLLLRLKENAGGNFRYNGPQKLDRELRWKTEESKVDLEVFPHEKNTQTIRRRI